MPLVLTIVNAERLENGASCRLELDRHGALIGRAPHMDWSLPDQHISSAHCEIEYRDGAYVLFDPSSTNGTFLNGSTEKLRVPHVIGEGDEISIGRFRIKASFNAAGAPAAPPPSPPPPPAAVGWDVPPPQASSQTPSWAAAPFNPTPMSMPQGAPQPLSAPLGNPQFGQGYAQPSSGGLPPLTPVGQGYSQPSSGGLPPMTPIGGQPASSSGGWADDPAPRAAQAWGSEYAGRAGAPDAAPDPFAGPSAPISGGGVMANNWQPPSVQPAVMAAPAPDNIWDRLAASNEMDWDRAGFGAKAWQPPEPAAAPPPPPSAPDAGAWQALLEAAGLSGVPIGSSPREAAAAAGGLLRRLIAGLVVMLEARARAKKQLGAVGTQWSADGNNPVKFARGPEEALAKLLNPPERGFMPANRAVEDAFLDLQAHQMATLVAMQGALRATLDRFSPAAIRERAAGRRKGLFGSKDAALWEAYEREFEGVAKGSDEAFMDVFAKAFREAYEQAARQQMR